MKKWIVLQLFCVCAQAYIWNIGNDGNPAEMLNAGLSFGKKGFSFAFLLDCLPLGMQKMETVRRVCQSVVPRSSGDGMLLVVVDIIDVGD